MSRPDVKRVFIGWDAPVLARAADAFLDHFQALSPLEMHDILVVLPGGRASRMFLRELASRGVGARPKIVTPGRLPDVILGIAGKPAPASILRLIWSEAIERCGEVTIARLASTLADTDRARVINSISRRIQAWHRELSGEGLRIRDAAEQMQDSGSGLQDRMAAAGDVETVYESLLQKHSLIDMSVARMDALAADVPARPHPIALVCISELGGLARSALDQVQAQRIALIAAPQSHAPGFDRIGCVVPSYWRDIEIPIPDDRIRIEETEQSCAAYALAALARDAGEATSDTVRLGVTEPQLSDLLEREAGINPDISLRSWTGRSISRTRIGILIDCLSRHLAETTFETYAALVRHPDVERYIDSKLSDPKPCWLEALDVFQTEYLPAGLPKQWSRSSRQSDHDVLSAVAEILDSYINPIVNASGDSPAIAAAIITALQSLYADSDADPDSELSQSCSALVAIVHDLASTLSKLDQTLDAGSFLALVSEELGRNAATPPHDDTAVQILGWLELPWDDADVRAILGMNDGYVPEAKSHDALLSETVRSQLRLPHDASRFARDCYLMQVIVHSTQRLTLLCARRDQAGSPLVPSRLLLRCSDASLVSRMQRVSGATPEPSPAISISPSTPNPPRAEVAFPIVPTAAHDPVTSMRVTSFKTYLRSPYLFFLQHVLNLREQVDSARELGPLEYGNLVHGVLESFGRSDVKNATDERVVEKYVLNELCRTRESLFGKNPLPAVVLQLQLLEFRLIDFAVWQAARARQGWTIEHVEWQAQDSSAGISVDNETMRLRGKIDRIDRNTNTGAVCVIDYKSGKEVESPEKTHRNKSGWTDLQLPLYRHLAQDVLADAPEIELAYVALPRRADGVKLLKAEWDESDLRDADLAASNVVRAIRNKLFTDPGDLNKANNLTRTLGALSGIAVTHPEPEEGAS